MKTGSAAAGNPLGFVAVAGLAFIVAVPFVFIVLQAIFPQLGRGSLAEPFLHLGPV